MNTTQRIGTLGLVVAIVLGCGGGGDVAEIEMPPPAPGPGPAQPLPVRDAPTPPPAPKPEPIVLGEAGPVPTPENCDSPAQEAFCDVLGGPDVSITTLGGKVSGVDLNCTCTITRTYKKLGAFIPIIKDTMKHHYRSSTSEETALYMAAVQRDAPLAAFLLENGAHPDAPSRGGIVPLTMALSQEHEALVKVLLEAGATPALADLSNCSDTDLIVLIMENGGRADTININPAVESGNLEEVKRLLVYEPDLSGVNGKKALENPELFELLLDHGMSVNVTDNFNNPILHVAVEDNDRELVELLLDKGAKINQPAAFDKTALMVAVEEGHKEMAHFLVERGAEVDKKGSFDRTGLFEAATSGKTAEVELWVALGADVNTTDTWDHHVLEEAIKDDNLGIIMLLVEAGARFNRKGQNPLEFARSEGASGPTITYLESAFD